MNPSADRVIETFATAMEENQMCPLRKGQLVELGDEGELWMTGDLHDHRRNFDKLLRLCDLASAPQRHLVLHELIHGDHFDSSGADGSWVTLYRAAELKCDYPGQVHFLLANHDLAQIHGEGIMKAGLSVCEAFNAGVRKQFGADAARVTIAMSEFLLSLPLGIRTASGLLCCHSLPTDRQVDAFDYSVFTRPLNGADYARRTGPVYQLIWGRNMSGEVAEKFAAKMGVDIILTGHQPQESGFATNGLRHLILASDHNKGVYLPLRLDRRYDMEALLGRITPFSSAE